MSGDTVKLDIPQHLRLPAMPPERHTPMPQQSLAQPPEARQRPAGRRATGTPAWRRWLVFGSSLAIAAAVVNEMRIILAVGGLSAVEYVVLFLFSLNFLWISFSFASALPGALRLLFRRRSSSDAKIVPRGRTAVLMPVYNERPEIYFATLERMIRAVQANGHAACFDWFVLSDTNNGDIALAEESMFLALRQRLARDKSASRVWYRRRVKNQGRKAGNIQDFCERWGAGFDYLVVLDADSVMEAETLIELVRRMEADPEAGLIQTVPRLIGGATLLARLQQFASRVYGPVIAAGLAWWSGREGNFWGHNAILRREAFMRAAGLPRLPGNPPLGGHILSHDFVEAALMRRAGWHVVIADDLAGSYEQSPASIVELAKRDRRWCQGNLQHTKVLRARGLHWVSRVHLLMGVMSYLSSPLWLFLILAGLALALQAHFIRPEYFPQAFALFPTWPMIDAERALRLFFISMLVLFTPKMLGLIGFILSPRNRREAGGVLRLLAGFVGEVLLSALLAPVMMLMHCKAVREVLFGKDSGWVPTSRGDDSVPFRELLRFHAWHMITGALLAVAAVLDSLHLLAWLSPALIGLLLAAPLSAAMGSSRWGGAFRKAGVLLTPEEHSPAGIITPSETVDAAYRYYLSHRLDFPKLIGDRGRALMHLALMDKADAALPGEDSAEDATVTVKILNAGNRKEAALKLNNREQALVLGNPTLFKWLAGLHDRDVDQGVVIQARQAN